MDEIRQIWCAEDNRFYPEMIEENGLAYRLDSATWTYLPLLTLEFGRKNRELMKKPIGSFGKRWQDFMRENYPFEIAAMEMRAQFGLIARRVDREAEALYERLAEQWTALHQPEPTTLPEKTAWEKLKRSECERAVMERVVLKHRWLKRGCVAPQFLRKT